MRNYQKLKGGPEAICQLILELLRADATASRSGGSAVIKMRRAQLSFGDGLIADEVADLREGLIKHADEVLKTNSWWRRSMRLCRSGAPRAAAVADQRRRPKWSRVC